MLQTHFKLAGPKKKKIKKNQKKKFAGPIRLKHVTLFGCRVRGETRVTSFYAGALCATVPIGRAQSQPTVPHASVLCTVQVVHSKQSSDGRLPRSCGLITVDSDIAPSLLYHQCFTARNHSALRSPSARLYGNLASAPCLLYEHKTFPPSLLLLLLSLSQDHSGRRPRSRVRIIVTLCAILCLSEISQPRTPVQANILLCALCPEHSQLP